MNKFSNILRYLKFLDKSSFFYFYIFIICILVFGMFGIIPLTSSIFEKITLLKNMNNALSSLNEKEKSLISASKDYEEIFPYIYYLDSYMPKDINLDDYIIGLNSVISINGFFLNRVHPEAAIKDNSLSVSINLDGYGNLNDLVKNIESLKRLTSISNLSVNQVKGRESIDITLQIFSR